MLCCMLYSRRLSIVKERGTGMKRYVIELRDDLAAIYEDIALMNHKTVEESLAIVLERVIRTMLNRSWPDEKK